MATLLRRMGGMRDSGVLGQLVRFAVAGGLSTLVFSIIYWPLATYGHRIGDIGGRAAWPVAANVLGYLGAMVSGYFLHSRWSFQGHGERGDFARTGGRFFAVSLVSFGLNTAFVAILTGPLHGPTWWPLVPIVFVTPLVTFALNRYWVFG